MADQKKAPKIPLQAIESSQISHIGHDAATSTLAVKFKRGALYHYPDVPADKYEEFRKAESPGKYFGQHLRSRTNYTRIDETAPADEDGEQA